MKTKDFMRLAQMFFFLMLFGLNAQTLRSEELSSYYTVAELKSSITEASQSVKEALIASGFEIIGSYAPENNALMQVIAFTRKDLQNICLKQEDRGLLASVLKVGLRQNGDVVSVSVLNPLYLFYAYLGKQAYENNSLLESINNDVFAAMQKVGNLKEPFGGTVDKDDLSSYRYMAFMPKFVDPADLQTFNSFNEGLSTIRNNLKAKKGNTLKVYELVIPNQQIAIFGVGLMDNQKGEAHFLPIIGENHIAAMPYEIILQGKEASMLAGKYRFALHWPKLSMGEFMKIVSTPGDVEDFMEGLTK